MSGHFYVSLGLDAASVAIVGYCVYAAARKGFLRTVAQLAAYLMIVFVAYAVSRAAAPVLYDRLVEPMLLGDVPIPNATLALAGGPEQLAVHPPQLPQLLELLPEGIDVDYWLERAQDGAEAIKDEIFEDLLESTVRPAAVNAISALCFTLIFCLLSVIANIALSAMGIVRHIPVIGRVNSFLGAVVGAGEGLLLVFFAALFLHGLLTLGQGHWWIFTERAARDSWIFRYFFDPSLLSAYFAG